MKKNNINLYLEALASKETVPGGGSAAALVAALGAGLIEKTCAFTIGKEKFKPIENECIKISKKAEASRIRFTKLIELDQKAYLPVRKAYKLPKETDEQRVLRKQKIDEALNKAMVVPVEIIKLCDELLPYCQVLEVNKALIGDTRCASAFLDAAKKGAESLTKIGE